MPRTVLICLSLLVLAGCQTFSSPAYRGPVTDNFDGEKFVNQTPYYRGSFWRWQMTSTPGEWTDEWANAAPAEPPPERVDGLRVTFINHSTVLIQVAGVNILTDPVYSYRTSPLSWVGPRRYRPPGIRFEDLPPIDVVIISHNHYDHLDLATLRRLEAAHSPKIYAGLGNGLLFEKEGLGYTRDLDWWQPVSLSKDTLLWAVPGQHFSGRGLDDRDETLWLGFVIDSPHGPVYFAGDTGWGPHFKEIRDRFGPMKLSVIPIGAYKPRWFMRAAHISPLEAAHAHLVMESEITVGCHYGTFPLADDGQLDPQNEMERIFAMTTLTPDEFLMLQNGESVVVD
jgi:L-ascorbate metabolism protein UlaG (beta-lactamase superfamily)